MDIFIVKHGNGGIAGAFADREAAEDHARQMRRLHDMRNTTVEKFKLHHGQVMYPAAMEGSTVVFKQK